METINSVMATWDGSYTLSYAVSMGAFFIGDGPKFFSVFRAQHPMTGLLVMSLKAEDFHNMGFSVRGQPRVGRLQLPAIPRSTFRTYATSATAPRTPRTWSTRSAHVYMCAPPLSPRYDPPGPMWPSSPMGGPGGS